MVRKTTSTKKSISPRKTSSTPKTSISSKPQKPVFRWSTIITIIILAALVGFAFYLNREKETADAEATPTGEGISYAFDVEAANINSIEVKPAGGEAVKLVRNESNAWALELPEQVEADQGLAESAASQAAALLIVSPIEGDPEIFGLDQPTYTITLEYADGSIHTLEVGDNSPTNNGYYVRVDKEKMLLVSLGAIDSLTNILAFPPYLNTPTPTALPPTETPVPPTAETTVTPTP
jgi:hypothetical protein